MFQAECDDRYQQTLEAAAELWYTEIEQTASMFDELPPESRTEGAAEMRRLLILCGAGLLVCALCAASRAVADYVVFSDDFEDGDISDWTTVEGGSGYVSVEQDPGPDWSLNIHSPSGTSSRAQALSPYFEMADSLDYEVSLEFGFETPIHWIEVFRNKHVNTVIDNCPGAFCTFRCRYGGSNYIVDSLYAYTAYRIEYRVHPPSSTYDVYVGGIFKRTCEFDPSSIPFPQFRIGDTESGSSNYGVAMYDDVVITQVPAAVESEGNTPIACGIIENRPNPFRAATDVFFQLTEPGSVCLRVYDVDGSLVATLLRRALPPGAYSTTWRAVDESGAMVGPGIYFVRIETGRFTDTKKMVLVE